MAMPQQIMVIIVFIPNDIDILAGPKEMPPLHLAASYKEKKTQ